LVKHVAYTVSVAVLVQHGSVIHGWVMVWSSKHARRVQVREVKLQLDQGGGVSTRVLKDGQERDWRVVVGRVLVMVVMWMVV
jgi:hypothetical protein